MSFKFGQVFYQFGQKPIQFGRKLVYLDSFQVCPYCSYERNCNEKSRLKGHLVKKGSFRHNLNYAFDQKTSLTKVVQFHFLSKET